VSKGHGQRTFSHAELDEKVRSLFAIGGLYGLVAYEVERNGRPRCTGEPTNVAAPWYVA